jgi:hypothetical protein
MLASPLVLYALGPGLTHMECHGLHWRLELRPACAAPSSHHVQFAQELRFL